MILIIERACWTNSGVRGEVLAKVMDAPGLQVIDGGLDPGKILLPDRHPRPLEDASISPSLWREFLLRPLPLGHIHDRTDVLNGLAGLVQDGVAQGVEVLDRPVGKDDSRVDFEILSFADRRREGPIEGGEVLGVEVLCQGESGTGTMPISGSKP